jgi:hypothetical protein
LAHRTAARQATDEGCGTVLPDDRPATTSTQQLAINRNLPVATRSECSLDESRIVCRQP